ncbi:electron transport complex subunit RsxD [Psychromonas antarctica]|jgi:electron transport complex protein RnfD|uniref:electron transport complex subunit RsxD n=1 Tax=Psychromonas antarctica TaxID=67573 RepID=UPI001EE93A0F|nr:electron transport complex subunit RsxD [Psychromonas antarctica]MCG6199899.1 electron transport complex subunit RsxD [Psychromonas antarctica]
MAFISSSSPYQRVRRSTSEIMLLVLLCLIPGIFLQSYFFGLGNLLQILLASTVALLSETLILILRKRPILSTIKDGSALLTGVLIAIAIPPLAPWWIAVIGTVFAVIFVKQLYGGLGQNIFNPAMAAYVLLLISFPVQMTTWIPVQSLHPFSLTVMDQINALFTGFTLDGYSVAQISTSIDGLTMATPLDTARNALNSGKTISEIFNSPEYKASSWQAIEWVNLGFLIGGLILLYKRVILWYIPIAFLAGISIFSFIAFAYNPDLNISPLFHLFSGATMLGAFFILTDPVTASTTVKGRIFYGVLAALIVVVIRNIGGYPDALAFAVLLANMCVPFIDYYTQPKVYGRGR